MKAKKPAITKGISIPFSTIKREGIRKDFDKKQLFQFHLVRLKAQGTGARHVSFAHFNSI